VARLRDATIAADRHTANNWRTGRAKHSTLCVLDDWCRKLVLVSSQVVVVGTFSGPCHVVDIATGGVVHTLVGLAGECSALACDGTTVVAGSESGSLACWSLATGVGGRLGAHAGAITALQIVEGGTQVLASSASGDILSYAITTGSAWGRHSRVLTADSPVLCLQRQGHYTAAGCIDGRVMVWAGGHGTSPLQLVLSFSASSAPITCLQMLAAADAEAADDEDEAGGGAGARTSLLVTGAGDGSVASWDLAAGGEALLDIGNAHRAPVTTLQADHSKIVTGGRDGVIRCWDASTGACRFSLAPFTAYLDGLAFRDGLLVATGSNNSVSLHNFGTAPVGPQRQDDE
jgi:WD40 repeat protein